MQHRPTVRLLHLFHHDDCISPGGSVPPVMMYTAVPGRTWACASRPAVTSSRTSNSAASSPAMIA